MNLCHVEWIIASKIINIRNLDFHTKIPKILELNLNLLTVQNLTPGPRKFSRGIFAASIKWFCWIDISALLNIFMFCISLCCIPHNKYSVKAHFITDPTKDTALKICWNLLDFLRSSQSIFHFSDSLADKWLLSHEAKPIHYTSFLKFIRCIKSELFRQRFSHLFSSLRCSHAVWCIMGIYFFWW